MNCVTGTTVDTRLAGAAYVESLDTLVVKFVDGRVYAVPLTELEGRDATPVTGVALGSDGYAVVLQQESGNRLEIPWDLVLYHAEPRYPFHKLGGIAAGGAPDRQEIGNRVRLERLKRNWTLADLSAHTGLKIPNLSRLERGRHLPSLDTLEKVAGAFGLPVVALVATPGVTSVTHLT
ncbi:MAG: helix-turn-helix domain-containing protein [Actinobacteria bacterium]|nr:helix-turn-helix domain-containing protein [Actinomycetota bacterium]